MQQTIDYILRAVLIPLLLPTSFFHLSSALLIAQEQPLFNGKNLQGWTLNHGQPITAGWEVIDGMIHLDPKEHDQEEQRFGSILTERDFEDFDLSFEWKIAKGGNSGLKYSVREYAGDTRGFEYQICDDQNYPKQLTPRTSAGSLYDLYEPNQEKHLLPVGEFNKSRIVVQGNHIQHWLNGRLIVSATIGSKDWKNRVAKSKFADLKGFGTNRRGKIMLTDHGSEVWYRNLNLFESSTDGNAISCIEP